jgi:uncharacterized membrane protein YhhN
MSLLRDILSELYSMFAGDSRLAIGVLVVVGASAGAAAFASPAAAGAVLLAGSVAMLVGSVLLSARKRS